MKKSVPQATGHQSGTFPRILVVTLAVLSATTPFATDLYLPAFLDIQSSFTATASSVQLTLTTFLIGAGLGQVVFGPLSDRLGRRGPLLTGLILFTVSSAAAALAPSIELLIAMRFLQGLSGAAGMVIGRAIVNDMVGGFEAARILNLFMLLGGIAPIVAPVMGSMLAEPLGWEGLLWIVAGIGGIGLVMAVIWAKESHPPHRRSSPDIKGGGRLANRQFIAATAVFVLSFMTLMAYVSASPFVYQTFLGHSIGAYGLFFAGNSIILITCSGISARRVATRGPRPLLRGGLISLLVGCTATLIILLTPISNDAIIVSIMACLGSLGFVLGNSTALAMAAVPATKTGFGSAMLGLFQFSMAGVISPLVGIAGEDTALPMALVMFTSTVLAFGLLALTDEGEAFSAPPASSHIVDSAANTATEEHGSANREAAGHGTHGEFS